MTSTAATTTDAYPERTALAAAAAVLVVAMGAVQSLQGDQDHGLRQWLIVAAIGLVALGVVLWGILPRIQPSGRAAVVFAVLAAVSVVVFWLDILPSLAVASILIALALRRRGESGPATTTALGLSGLALVAYVLASIFG